MPSQLTRFLRSTFVMVFAALWASCLHAAPTVTVRAHSASPLAAYGIADWTIVLNQTYANPFDPDEIAVDATFTGPHNQTLRLPGFWFQEFRRQPAPDQSETLIPVGSPEWRVRFCPPQPGRWRLVVTARDHFGVGTSPALTFTVQLSSASGFVRRVPGSDYLQYDNGKPYFLVGENVGWAGNTTTASHIFWSVRMSAGPEKQDSPIMKPGSQNWGPLAETMPACGWHGSRWSIRPMLTAVSAATTWQMPGIMTRYSPSPPGMALRVC